MSEQKQPSASDNNYSDSTPAPEPSEVEVASTIAELEQDLKPETATSEVQPQTLFADFSPQKNRLPGSLMMIFGVLLPVFALGFEIVTKLSADIFVDPQPTILHTVLIAFVPLGNLLVWLAVRLGKAQYRNHLGLINGIVLGIAKFYSGGGGLVSTARDYLRFCQLMLNGGELDGVRLLSPKTVQLMTMNYTAQAQKPTIGVALGEGAEFGLGYL